jgi:hypothetical protein
MENEQSLGPSLTSVACNHCGAPLEIQTTTRFLTCTYCGAKLEVHRSGGSLYTEVLESIDQRTQRMEQDLDVIKRQNEVERLDREWMLRREQFLTRNKDGSTSPPSAVGTIVGPIVAVVFGIIWMVGAASAGAPVLFVVFGLVFVVAAMIAGITGAGKAAQYQDQQRAYEQQRQQLLSPQRPNQPGGPGASN